MPTGLTIEQQSRIYLAVTLLFCSLSLVCFVPVARGDQSQTATMSSQSVEALSLAALLGQPQERLDALDALVARAKPDIIPTLVMMMRLSGNFKPMAQALSQLTGATIETWRDAMVWQEANSQIVPHKSYRRIKLRFLFNTDPGFEKFFDPELTTRDRMKIRLEEISWGGALADGIPPLDSPAMISAGQADYLIGSDLVFGVAINGDVRAYPLRIMGWHEMVNDVIGGVPVALAYCTLCGAGILFETLIEGREKPLIFGSSGLLYRSNKLMFDRETNSLWNQFTGEPVVGRLAKEPLKLKIRPLTITSWRDWHAQHPDTKVLSLETGHFRDYGSGVVYRDYFASPDLMFPALIRDESVLQRKDYVFGIRDFAAAKAWPLSAFRKTRVINDKMASRNLVLLGDAATRTVRAYHREEEIFTVNSQDMLSSEEGTWQIGEEFLTGPNGERRVRVPGHISYWFAWDSYLGVKAELYERPQSAGK